MKSEPKRASNRMMTVEEYNEFTKALMEKNRRENAGKPPKPPVKPANYPPHTNGTKEQS